MILFVVCCLALASAATERVAAARPWPRLAGWWPRAIAFNALRLGVAWLAGRTREAAAYAIQLSGVAELFYHGDVSTPHWLGYLVQRPESRCVHHQPRLHAGNYGDLPLGREVA